VNELLGNGALAGRFLVGMADADAGQAEADNTSHLGKPGKPMLDGQGEQHMNLLGVGTDKY
jgi:hypothetical protein